MCGSTVPCKHGVWQGDPLGMHSFIISTMNFIAELVTKLRPHNVFREYEYAADRELEQGESAAFVSIADDLVVVTRNQHSVRVAKMIFDIAERHGVRMSASKLEIYSAGSESGKLELEVLEEFKEMGIEVNKRAQSSSLCGSRPVTIGCKLTHCHCKWKGAAPASS